MIGIGGIGHGAVGGNSWPSASNLSALAPPFTVDRLNPNPNSTVEPGYNAWECMPQSAVGSDLFIDSIGVSSVPSSDAYQFSATSSSPGPSTTHWSSALSPGAKDSACAFGYSSYDTCVGGEAGIFDKNKGLAPPPIVNPAFDSAESSMGWEYGRGWVDGLGFDNGKRPKMGQLDSMLWSNATAVDPLYHNQLNQGVHSIENRNRYEEESVPFKFSNHAPDWGFHEGSSGVGPAKNASYLEQNTSFFSYDVNDASGSTNYPESNFSFLACESPNNFSNYQNPYDLYKHSDKPTDTPFISPPTVRGPSSSFVIQSPHATDGSSEQSFASRLHELNALGGFSMACGNAQVRNSTEIASDFDSPCWKGAPSSKISPFNLEVGNCKYMEKNLNGYFENQGLHLPFNSDRVLPESNSWECARNDVLTSGRDVSAVSSNEEQSSSNCTMHRVSPLTKTNCKGVEIGSDADKLKNLELLTSLTGGFDLNGSDIKHVSDEECPSITPNEASECSLIAVLSAEKVLASPPSQEDTVKCPKLNVQSVIKAMHNLSDLLLFHLSNEAFSLDEENLASLKHIMSNLDSCVGKRALVEMKMPEPNNPMGETSKKLEDQSSDAETISESSHTVNKTANSHIEPDSHHLHQKEEVCNFSGKKDEKFLHMTPFTDDLDGSTNHNMTKAIQRILEENFGFDEDMNSQSELFKRLWLESEAKLFSIGYKARFDRMKTQMESMKQKAKDNKYLLEMMSKDGSRSGLATASGHAIKSHDGTDPNPNSKKISDSSLDELADDIMARLSILNAREDNLNPINAEEEQGPEMDDELMARFNILRSREENSKLISSDEKENHAMISTADVKPCVGDHSENKMFSWDLNSHFQCQTDVRSLGKFDSYVDSVGCESPDELYHVVTNNQAIPSAYTSTATNDQNTGWNESYISVTNNQAIPSTENSIAMKDENTGDDVDSPSSDWEHVLKDYF